GHKDMYALQLAADLLNRRTGRLYKSLVEDKKVAVGEPYATFRPMKYAGYFEAGAEVKEGVEPTAVEKALLAELDRLAQEPVGESELQKVKNQQLANSFRRLQTNFFLMLQLALYDSFGNWRFINEAPAKVQAVTAQDIQAVAARTFTKENRNVAIYVRKAGTSEDPELAALPAELKGMVKQQLAQIEKMKDAEKLGVAIAQMQQMAAKVPPQMKPALDFLLKKMEQRLAQLQGEGKEE
ncbi:MAG: M16 family metallopeptidase, partial [Thermoanaerobaculum sp.]